MHIRRAQRSGKSCLLKALTYREWNVSARTPFPLAQCSSKRVNIQELPLHFVLPFERGHVKRKGQYKSLIAILSYQHAASVAARNEGLDLHVTSASLLHAVSETVLRLRARRQDVRPGDCSCRRDGQHLGVRILRAAGGVSSKELRRSEFQAVAAAG